MSKTTAVQTQIKNFKICSSTNPANRSRMEVIHENQTTWLPLSNEPLISYRENSNDMGEVLQKR